MNDPQLQRIYQQIDLFTEMLSDAQGDETETLRRRLRDLHGQAARLETANESNTSDPPETPQSSVPKPLRRTTGLTVISLATVSTATAGILMHENGRFDLTLGVLVLSFTATLGVSLIAFASCRRRGQVQAKTALVGFALGLTAIMLFLAVHEYRWQFLS